MPDEKDKLKKLYSNISAEYELPKYDVFLQDMQDTTKRRKLYDAISTNYELPDYDTFQTDMGWTSANLPPIPGKPGEGGWDFSGLGGGATQPLKDFPVAQTYGPGSTIESKQVTKELPTEPVAPEPVAQPKAAPSPEFPAFTFPGDGVQPPAQQPGGLATKEEFDISQSTAPDFADAWKAPDRDMAPRPRTVEEEKLQITQAEKRYGILESALTSNPDAFWSQDKRENFYRGMYDDFRKEGKTKQEFTQAISNMEKKWQTAAQQKHYGDKVKRNPDDAESRYYLASSQLRGDKFNAAANNFRALTESNPTLAEAYTGLAFIAAKNKRYGLAIQELDLGIEANPTNAGLLHNRSIYKTIVGDYNTAIADLDKAIGMETDEENLALMHLQRGKLYQRLEEGKTEKSAFYAQKSKNDYNKSLQFESQAKEKPKEVDLEQRPITAEENIKSWIRTKELPDMLEAILTGDPELGAAGFIMNPIVTIARGGVEGVAHGAKDIYEGVSESDVGRTVKGVGHGAIAALMAATPVGWLFTAGMKGAESIPYVDYAAQFAMAPISQSVELLGLDIDQDWEEVADLVFVGFLFHKANSKLTSLKERSRIKKLIEEHKELTPEQLQIIEQATREVGGEGAADVIQEAVKKKATPDEGVPAEAKKVEAKAEEATDLTPEQVEAKGRIDSYIETTDRPGASNKAHIDLLKKNPKAALQILIDHHEGQSKSNNVIANKFHKLQIEKLKSLQKDYDVVYAEKAKAQEVATKTEEINKAREKALADIEQLEKDNPLALGVEELRAEVEADFDAQIKALTEPKKISEKTEALKKKRGQTRFNPPPLSKNVALEKKKKGDYVVEMGEGKPEKTPAKGEPKVEEKVDEPTPPIEKEVAPEAETPPAVEPPKVEPPVVEEIAPEPETTTLQRRINNDAKRLVDDPSWTPGPMRQRFIDANREAIDKAMDVYERNQEALGKKKEALESREVLGEEDIARPKEEKATEISVEEVGEEPVTGERGELQPPRPKDIIAREERLVKKEELDFMKKKLDAEVGKTLTREQADKAFEDYKKIHEEVVPVGERGVKAQPKRITDEAMRDLKAEAKGRKAKRTGKYAKFYEKNKDAIEAEKERIRKEGVPEKKEAKAETEAKPVTNLTEEQLQQQMGVKEFVKTEKEVPEGAESVEVTDAISKALDEGKVDLAEVVEAHKEILGEDITTGVYRGERATGEKGAVVPSNAKTILYQLAERGIISKERWKEFAKKADANINNAINRVKPVRKLTPEELRKKMQDRVKRLEELKKQEREKARKIAEREGREFYPEEFDKKYEATLRTRMTNWLKQQKTSKEQLNKKMGGALSTFGITPEMVRVAWNASIDFAINSINAGAEIYGVIKKLVEDIRKTDWYKKKTLKERDFIEKSIEYHIEEGVRASERVLEEAKDIKAEQERARVEGVKEGLTKEQDTAGKLIPEEPTTEGVKLEKEVDALTESERARNVEEAKRSMEGEMTSILIPRKLLGMEKLTPEQRQAQLEKIATDYWDIKEYWEKAVKAATGKTLEEFTKDKDLFDLDVDQMNQLKIDNPKEFGKIFEMKTRMMEGMDDFMHLSSIVEGTPIKAEVRAQMAVLKFTEAVKNGLFPDLGMEVQQNSFLSRKQAKAMVDLTAEFINSAIRAGFRGKELVDKVLQDLKDSKFYESIKDGVKFDAEKFDRKAERLIKTTEENIVREEDFKQLKELVDSYKEDGLTKEEIMKELPEESRADISAAFDGEALPPSTTGGGKPPAPPKPPTQQLSPASPGRVEADIEAGIEMTKKQREEAETNKKNSKTWWDRFMKTTVDRSARIINAITNIDPETGYKAGREFRVKAGAAGKTAMEYTKALEEIYGSLRPGAKKIMTSGEQKLLADYIQYKRTMEVDRLADEAGEPRPKSPNNIHTEQIQNIMEGFRNNNPKLLEAYGMKSFDIAKLDALTEKYTDVMKGKLKDKLDAGLISEEAYNELKDIMYSPRKFIQYLDQAEVRISGKGGKMNVSGSGIKEITEGSEQALVNNPQLLLLEVIGRTNALISKNKANQALAEFAKANPENGIVEIAKATPEYIADPTGVPKYIDPRPRWEAIDYMENGVRKRMNVLEEYADGWNDNPVLESRTAEFLHHASGTSILKFLATTANPEFAVGNFFRDMAHIYLTTDVYSPNAAKYTAQLGSDIAAVFNDVVSRTGRVIEYIKEGGSMDLLSDQSMPRPKIGKYNPITEGTNMLVETISYIGQTSELLTRLAIRERYIKKETRRIEAEGKAVTPEMLKEIKKEGTYRARNYLDFSQGGEWAKAVDKVVPYLNAGIQGTRGTFRAAQENPALFSAKVAQLAGITTLLTANNLTGDERKKRAYEKEISTYEKAANFIIMTGTWENDDQGRRRYHYIKIPKDQGQQLITGIVEDGIKSSLFGISQDRIMTDRRWLEANHLISALPNVGSLPPAIKAVVAYSQNRNMFYGKDIWTGREQSDVSLERDIKTPYAYSEGSDLLKSLGMEISPERAKVAVEQIIPKNSTLAGLAGMGISSITGGMSPAEKNKVEKTMGEHISKMMGARKLFGVTNPDYRTADIKEKVLLKNDELTRHDLELDQKVAEFGPDSKKWTDAQLESVAEWAKTFEPKEEKRLLNAVESYSKGADYWTISLKRAPVDVAARIFAEEWLVSSKEERDQMVERANKVKLLTPDFTTLFNRYKEEIKSKENSGRTKLIKSQSESETE